MTIASCAPRKMPSPSAKGGAVPQIEFCSLQGHVDEWVHLTAKYTMDNKLHNVYDKKCKGMGDREVSIVFVDRKDNMPSQKFKEYLQKASQGTMSAVFLVDAIGKYNLNGDDAKFEVASVIDVRANN